MVRIIAASVSGLLFGIGLTVSQMVNPVKVLDFLDLSGNWDPSLVLVMVEAISVTYVSYHFFPKLTTPLLDTSFKHPTLKEIDRRLIIGAALFGVGWGMTGYCPGPAIAGAGMGFIDPVITLISIVIGFSMYRVFFEAKS